jgi:hypothetical protein
VRTVGCARIGEARAHDVLKRGARVGVQHEKRPRQRPQNEPGGRHK